MLTLVLFTAFNCAACKSVKPVIEELKTNYEDCEVVFTTIEIGSKGENMDVAQHWGVSGVPTIILINKKTNEIATEVARLVGAENMNYDKVVYCIESFLVKDEQRNIQSEVL
jgi:thiol-disulfide isomerase/thioredoxin